MKQIMEAKNLCKDFKVGNATQQVLKDLNITINEGDFVVIMGSSGSGKSTLLYSLSGMDRPTSGVIAYKGEEIQNYSNDKLAVFRRKNCGFVFQQSYLNDTMTVMNNILVSGLLMSKDKKAIKKEAIELMKAVGLNENTVDKYPSQMSGGECQRVAMVRGLINKPAILFADEPTGALNSQNTQNVLDILTKMNQQGQTVVMVTHDMKSARRGNVVKYLSDGVISGECELGKYVSGDKERHEKLRNFLQEMGW